MRWRPWRLAIFGRSTRPTRSMGPNRFSENIRTSFWRPRSWTFRRSLICQWRASMISAAGHRRRWRELTKPRRSPMRTTGVAFRAHSVGNACGEHCCPAIMTAPKRSPSRWRVRLRPTQNGCNFLRISRGSPWDGFGWRSMARNSDLAKKLLQTEFARRRGRPFRQIKLNLLDAKLHYRMGVRNHAQRSLGKALKLAAPGGYVRCFLG